MLHVMNAAGGGASLSTQSLARALRAHGVQSSAICHDAGSAQEKEGLLDAFEGRVRFTRLMWWNRKTRAHAWKRPLLAMDEIVGTGVSVRSTLQVVRAARDWGTELIHTNTLVNPEGAFSAAVLGLPHVWHVRELVGEGQPYRFVVEGRAFGAMMASLSSMIVCNSATTAAKLRPWLGLDAPLTVVENGVDLAAFEHIGGGYGRRPIVVGMVGSITTRWKKHELFVEVVSRARTLFPQDVDARFVIFGRLPQEGDAHLTSLRRAIERSGVDVELKGFVDDPVAVMRELDVMLHPASAESFGRIAAEAMAAGIPVVGVRAGGVADIVVHGETGFLADVDDADAMATFVAQLVADPALRAQMGGAGRARAAARYSLNASARNVARIYESARRAPPIARRSKDALSALLRRHGEGASHEL